MARFLDTTVLIDILEQKPDVAPIVEYSTETFFTSQLNVFELMVGVFALKENQAKHCESAERLLSRFHILDLTPAAVRLAAQIQGKLYQQGRPINDVDSLIAAIALSNGINIMITRNKKHFEQIKELTVVTY